MTTVCKMEKGLTFLLSREECFKLVKSHVAKLTTWKYLACLKYFESDEAPSRCSIAQAEPIIIVMSTSIPRIYPDNLPWLVDVFANFHQIKHRAKVQIKKWTVF